jgi:hypothetical protein
MRCPTCGAPVMVRKDSWECGYCCDCGNLPRPRIVLTVDVEEEPKLTIESLAENADPDTALLLRKFSKTLGAWDVEELSAMGAVEILERAYGEDHREGIAMWSALLYAAGSRLKAPREARWLLHSCCPYGTDDLSPELLDELQRDEKLSRLVFQSAYVGEEQYHLIDMASELRRSEPVTDLRRAIGINDKFLMIRDLFDGDARAYEAALDKLDAFGDFDDCMIYIAENYAWNANSDGAKFLMELLERKFA